MKDEILFPHDEIRDIQDTLIEDIQHCIENKKSLVAHAPTGLGKTAASLAPALTYALKNKKTIFFLTSRHTQHQIAIDTLKKIKEKHGTDIVISDIIGKKHMCLQSGVETLYSNQFFEYCKSLREDGKCEFYNNTYTNGTKLSVRSKKVLNDLLIRGTCTTKEIIQASEESPEKLCPYEIAQQMAKSANVIIADYYYLFNPSIRNNFLNKIGKDIEDIIIIVDEAHNLPERIRELMTVRITKKGLDAAEKEANKLGYEETSDMIKNIKNAILDLTEQLDQRNPDMLISKQAFMKKIEQYNNYDKMVDDLAFIGKEIREEKQRSYIAALAEALEIWKGEDLGFVRYLRKEEDNILLCYRCLDPSIYTADVVNAAHSVIMMSGTLNPTYMYRDLLGFKNVIEKDYESPFPEENRLCMVVPETSTKFTARSEQQYRRIAEICANIGNNIPGNVAFFFPSYYLLGQVEKFMKTLYEKTLFTEQSRSTNEEKHNMIERFKSYKDKGAGLLAVATGSYGEGIDLPGDLLKAVVIIGLPLQKPDLETQELINYYDKKFQKGWDYGYLFPAFNKTLQNAGRCIRSKNDRGVIVFLDERYAWKNYFRCFPKDMHIKITRDFNIEIVEFFQQ
ncbi:ATP-dependent DNA helicase [Candidatus Woesearchaeota archaeon]|nr:ATP-dependent DNA helicase [Candidatus Woesearchaeota archaeon]